MRERVGKNGVIRLPHSGMFVVMHSAPPPHESEYDAWLSLQLAKTRGTQTNITGAKLRRMVIMRRAGETYESCARAIGMSAASPARKWIIALPEGLAP